MDMIPTGGLELDAHVIRLDWHLAMSSVDEDSQLDLPRSAVVRKRVKGGADGPPGEKNIIDEDQMRTLDFERDVALLKLWILVQMLVVIAIERDIENSESKLAILLGQKIADTLGHLIAAAADPDQCDRTPIGSLTDRIRKYLDAFINLLWSQNFTH